MRPSILNGLFSSLISVPGIGDKIAQILAKNIGSKVLDLLFYMPASVTDRSNMPPIHKMAENTVITTKVRVEKYINDNNFRSKQPIKVLCANSTGVIDLVFFRSKDSYIKKILPLGEERFISGRVDRFAGKVQIIHPDYITKNLDEIGKIEVGYGLFAGIRKKTLAKAMVHCIDKLPTLPEWLSEEDIAQNNWLEWRQSITNVHCPKELQDIDITSKYRRRLAYDELLASQLALALVRKENKKTTGRSFKGSGDLRKKLLDVLPFNLTSGQEVVIKDIAKDQESASKMVRLLQGDVGSGKTVVCLFAMLCVVECKAQAALMSPTEILALQHKEWIESVVGDLGVKVALLTGNMRASEKSDIIQKLSAGDIDIIVGTHALFQESVSYKDLGLVVIDEQHRFGVKQRLSLVGKGANVDSLMMSATPIPRTLTMTIYGDMDVSILKDKPVGRKPINTKVVSFAKVGDVVSGIKRVIDKGEKVYWICPLIEESEVSELAAAEERYENLQKIFTSEVALMHGKMKADEREEVMEKFKNGGVSILVATTVVEVGVDVRNATVIVIEHAERFGLSQLHQLRGRVGRGDKQSSCILMYHNLGKVAKQRLSIMRQSNDGFVLAEEDLKIRGGGDILGIQQSGMPGFRLATLPDDCDLLAKANKDAKQIISNDRALQSSRGKALQILLYLFEYDQYVKYLDG